MEGKADMDKTQEVIFCKQGSNSVTLTGETCLINKTSLKVFNTTETVVSLLSPALALYSLISMHYHRQSR